MGIFLGILFVLALITVVGHGIWVLVAGVFRSLAGRPHAFPDGEKRTDRPVLRADELGDLEAAARQVARFRNAALLDDVMSTRIQALIEERRRILAQPEPGPSAIRAREALTAGRLERPLWQRLEELLESGDDVLDLRESELW